MPTRPRRELACAATTNKTLTKRRVRRSMGVVEWSIGLHFSHDAHLTVLRFGIPLLVLELERLTERRYFTGFYVGADERERVVEAWEAAGEAAREAALGAMVEVRKRSASTSVGDFQFDVGCFNLVSDGGFAGEGPHDAMFRDACHCEVGSQVRPRRERRSDPRSKSYGYYCIQLSRTA